MALIRSSIRTSWTCLAFLVGAVGCAETPYVLPPPPTEAERADYGRLTVILRHVTPELEMAVPAKGAGAGAVRGAGLGVLGIATDRSRSGPVGLVLRIVLMPAGAVVGAGIGAAQAVPAEQIENAETTLKTAFLASDANDMMREAIIRQIETETTLSLTTPAELGPDATGDLSSYRAAIEKGVATILEVSIQSIDLAGPKTINPPLMFVMSVVARLVRTSDNAELHRVEIQYQGASHVFTAWAENGAAPFMRQQELAYHELSQKIVDEFFLLYMPDLSNQTLTDRAT